MTKFSARNVGDFSEAAGEREIAPKCGSFPRDAGDLVGLHTPTADSKFLFFRAHFFIPSVLRELRVKS